MKAIPVRKNLMMPVGDAWRRTAQRGRWADSAIGPDSPIPCGADADASGFGNPTEGKRRQATLDYVEALIAREQQPLEGGTCTSFSSSARTSRIIWSSATRQLP